MKRILIVAVCLVGLVTAASALADGFEEAGGPAMEPTLTSSTGGEVEEPEPEPTLHDRFVHAILKSRSIKQKGDKRRPYWFECGKRIKTAEAREKRANEWVTWLMKAIEKANVDYGTDLNPWGVLAVAHNEGGFNVCSLDLQTREWAVEVGLVKHLQHTYNRDTVYKILSSKQYRNAKRKADLGPLQVRYKAKFSRERLDQILSLDPGLVEQVAEMADRSLDHLVTVKGEKKPYPRPWRLWPGLNPRAARSCRYDRRITSVAKWLGAKPGEI